MGMYDVETGRFRYSGKPLSKMSRKADGHPSREFKYRLYHVIEDDWLTYYMVRKSAGALKVQVHFSCCLPAAFLYYFVKQVVLYGMRRYD